MEAIIKTSDGRILKSILRFLRDMGFEVVLKEEKKVFHREKSTDEERFFDASGIWEGRDISKEKLRKMSWRKA